MKVTELRPEPKLPPPTGYILELTPAEVHILRDACVYFGKISSLGTREATERFTKLIVLDGATPWSPEICFRD